MATISAPSARHYPGRRERPQDRFAEPPEGEGFPHRLRGRDRRQPDHDPAVVSKTPCGPVALINFLTSSLPGGPDGVSEGFLPDATRNHSGFSCGRPRKWQYPPPASTSKRSGFPAFFRDWGAGTRFPSGSRLTRRLEDIAPLPSFRTGNKRRASRSQEYHFFFFCFSACRGYPLRPNPIGEGPLSRNRTIS